MLEELEIIKNEALGEKLYRLVLRGPVAREAQPGQFVHVQVSKSHDPLLRRPLSIAWISREDEEITVLYRVQGQGTALLTESTPGSHLSVMGPVGSGFSVPPEGELWLVAGGIGAFPLYALAAAARERGLKVRLFWGGENAAFLAAAGLASWQELGVEVQLATMDGSLGHRGLVTEVLAQQLINLAQQELKDGTEAYASNKDFKRINLSQAGLPITAAACGPNGMLKAVAAQCAAAGLPLEVSLEERMGCAVGACLGCVATVRDQEGKVRRAKVCKDGPVFRGEEVVWDGD